MILSNIKIEEPNKLKQMTVSGENFCLVILTCQIKNKMKLKVKKVTLKFLMLLLTIKAVHLMCDNQVRPKCEASQIHVINISWAAKCVMILYV